MHSSISNKKMSGQKAQDVTSKSLVGFSPKINDPAFAAYIKNYNRWAIIFSLGLAVVAVVGFFIAGVMGVDGMSNPEALFIGLAVGGMFLLIAFFQIMRTRGGKTWDGIVEKKKTKKKTESQHSGEDVHYEDYIEYSVIIRRDNGKKHVLKSKNDFQYKYLQVGDKIRYHGKLNSIEKHDKTGDLIIPCNACGVINDIKAESCSNCKCPLLN